MGATEHTRTIASNAIDTNFKTNILISSATTTLNNVYPIKNGMTCRLSVAGGTITVDNSAGNIKMTSDFVMTAGDTLALEARDISGTLYWLPTGGKSSNA